MHFLRAFWNFLLKLTSIINEFIQNGDKAEYRAAVKVLKEITDENRDEGRITREGKVQLGSYESECNP